MAKQLIFVHGRAQERCDPAVLKNQWISSWRYGLSMSNLDIPISIDDIKFPYYGDTLYDIVTETDKISDITIQKIDDGAGSDYILPGEAEFVYDILSEVEFKLTGAIKPQGIILGWSAVRNIISYLDSNLPLGSGTAIYLATRDVYMYLRNPGLQQLVESGVRSAIEPGVESVIVGHSLGSVISYNILKRDGLDLGFKISDFITIGCPLAVRAIKNSLQPIQFPECVGNWFNAMDNRDIVALYPLDSDNFPVTPKILNKTDIDNERYNYHGSDGYLQDPVVAKRIYDALVSH